LDYLPLLPISDPDIINGLLSESQFSYSVMPPRKEEGEELTNFTLESLTNLFEPIPLPNMSPEPPTLISPAHSTSGVHGRNLSAESASSFTTAVEGLHPLSPTTRSSARISKTHCRSTSSVSNHSPTYEPYLKHSLQSRKRAISDDEDQSEELEPLDPNATEEQKKEYKRRQNTLAARRSRKKKANETHFLRDENARLKTEIAIWKERALMMQRLLITAGVACPNFST